MNKVNLVGRLARDPELRTGNVAVTRFTVAVNRRYKREGEPDADFISCVAFSKTAEFIGNYFVKGMAIGLSGRIQVRSYTDKNGNKAYATEVVAEEAEFTERKAAVENQAVNRAFTQNEEQFDPDSLPF